MSKKTIRDIPVMTVNFGDPDVKIVMVFRTKDAKTDIIYVDRNKKLKSQIVNLDDESHFKFIALFFDNFKEINTFRKIENIL